MQILPSPYPEYGSGTITATFTDEEGTAITPASLTWTLTNLSGTVINSREDEELTVTSNTVTVNLNGADLQVLSSETASFVWRAITFEGTYLDDGSTKNIRQECRFRIENLTAI